MFCFPILFPHYQTSFSPCFWDNATNVKTNNELLFTIPFPLKCLCETPLRKSTYFVAGTDPVDLYGNIYCTEELAVFLPECSNFCTIPMNMVIEIYLKTDLNGLQQSVSQDIFSSF